MNELDRYCVKVRKKTERLLRKLFGCRTVSEGLSAKARVTKWLEISSGKSINEFNADDIGRCGYLYAKYRTLDKILSIYIDLVGLNLIGKGLEGESHGKGGLD